MRPIRIILGLTIILLLVSCFQLPPSNMELTKYKTSEVQENNMITNTEQLTIWTPEVSYEIDNAINSFKEAHPNINVEVTTIDSDEIVDTYRDSMINKNTPDIFVIPDKNLGTFSGLNALDNLSNEQEYGSVTLDSFPDEVIQNYTSFHNDDYVFALPIATFPKMTFYRADILANAGFPTDPTLLAEFMKDEDNFKEMAKHLKDQGYFIMEYQHSLLTRFNDSSNYFDKQLNYLGNQDSYQKLFNVSKYIHDNELYLGNTIWGPEGLQALEEDRLVMFYLASYGQDRLKEWVPEQAGKWRVTHLPLGKVGFDRSTGKSLAISSYSNNKALAWEFLQLSVHNVLNKFHNKKNDDFFGNQDVYSLYRDIMQTNSLGIPTPLDKAASDIWELYLYKANTGEPIQHDDYIKIENEINERVRLDKRALLNLTED